MRCAPAYAWDCCPLVGFDPDSRWHLGGSYAFGLTATEDGNTELQTDAGQLDTGFAYRHALDLQSEGVAWKLYHQVLPSRLRFASGGSQFATTLYAGRFIRWARDGKLLLATSPPQHVPFPLNIGVDTTIGDLRFANHPNGWDADLGVVSALVALDFWRRRALGSYAELGLGPTYGLRFAQASEQELETSHVVAPFTQASFLLRHESTDGRHAVHSRLGGGYAWSDADGWGWRAAGAASYEAILLAVNDLPVSCFAEVGYRYEQPHPSTRTAHELRTALGARFGVPLTGW